MHQEIETENKRRSLITAIMALVNTFDTVQACILLKNLGGYEQDFFTLRGTAFQTSVSSMLKSADCFRPLTEINIIFDGGPTEIARYKGTVATFIVDRVLREVSKHGLKFVKTKLNDIVDWKNKSYEEEKSDEWNDLAAAERYAG